MDLTFAHWVVGGWVEGVGEEGSVVGGGVEGSVEGSVVGGGVEGGAVVGGGMEGGAVVQSCPVHVWDATGRSCQEQNWG